MKTVAIYGAGKTGRKLPAILGRTGVGVVCFFDAAQHGQTAGGVPIYSIDKAPQKILLARPRRTFQEKREQNSSSKDAFFGRKSLLLYDAQIAHRLGADWSVLPEPDWDDVQYLPSDVPLILAPYNFVDIGAFDGDTLSVFKKNGINLNKLAAYEPDAKNFAALVERVKTEGPFAQETYLIPAGVAETCGNFAFSESGDMSSSMDIEGAEMSALLGMKNTIQKYAFPQLAVCVYHRPDDLYEIPLTLSEWNPGQKFYLRMYNAHCWETVLYVVPRR